MNTSQGRLFYATGIDNSQLRNDAAESRNILHSIGQTAKQESANIDAAFSKIAKTAGGIFAASKLMELTKQIISVRGEIERLEISFETLAGKAKGNALFNEIRQFATSTPMMMKDLAQGAQTMLAFNIEVEKVMPMLRAIGDISMGDAQKFNSLSLAFSQMSATGKLMGQDLLQMINAGFNPLSVISEKTGKTIGELKEEMEKGKITVDMVTDAFIAATSEGGKFYGMLEKQSHGIEGAISNFQGAVDDALNEMGASIQDTAVSIVDAGTYLVKHYDTLLDIVGVLVATYGTYRAALIINTAVERMMATANAERIALIESEISAIGIKTAEEQLSIDADIAAAVAKGNLTEAEGLHILMLKQEAAARVESLALAAKQAAAELANATAARQAAGVKLQAAESNAAAMRMEYEAALAKGEVFEIALAKERLETAQTQINTASQQYQAAATAETTAAKAAQTAQTTANTAAQELNNLQIQQGTLQTGVFATAVRTLTNTLKGLWATMMKHPVALVLAAVVALGVAIYNVTKRTRELSAEQRILDDVTGKATAAVEEEKTRVETLSKIVHDNTKKLEERKTALGELQKIVPDYHAALTREGNLINDNTDALNRYIEALMKAAKLEAIKGGITETFKELTNLAMDVKTNYSDWGWFLNLLSSEESIERNKQDWTNWYNDFIKDPSKYTRKGKNGRTEVLFGSGIGASWLHADMGEDWISDESRKLIKAAEKYAEYSRLYKDILAEDVTTTSKKTTSSPKAWQTEVAEQRKKLADAQAEVKRLQASATATTEEVKNAQDAVDTAKKKLKELGFDVDKSNKAGVKASEVQQSNADMLANEAANRRKQEEEYAKQLADQVKDSEFEIRQARIDAMKDGIDKELMQNELNYDRLIEQNKRRERDLLDNLADEQMRIMEDADPTLFKKKNKDGKWEEDPGKRDEMYREIRAKLTIEDLDPQQKAQIEEFGRIAALAFEQSNKESMDKMLQDVLTYEQQRTKIAEEYARKRKDLYEKNADGSTKTDADGNPVFRKGATQGNLDELNRQETEALKAIDEQFAQREETYQAWCEEISNLSLRQLEAVLEDAKKRLEELEKSGSKDEKALAQARAKVTTAQQAVNKANAKNQTNPGKRTIKEWEDLYKTLNDVEKEFESIGDTVGGTVGEIISECGQFATSTLTMINGIVQLTQMSATSIQGTAAAGATAISTMEKASVILTVISAAMQIAMQIVNLFNSDDEKQEEIEHLQERIDQLQWELDHQEIGRVQAEYGTAISRLNKALMETRLQLAAGATGWQRFVILAGQASRNTELMQKTAEKLAKAYGNMAYTADKALGGAKYQQANDQLKNIAQQQILLQDQINAEASKKKTDNGAIQEWKNKIEELGQQAIELINDMVEDIIGDTSNGIAEELADAFFEAFQAGEDAAEAWGDKVNDIVADVMKRMLISKFLEEPLGQIFDKYKAKWFKDGEFQGLDSVINSMEGFASDLNAIGADFAEIWENLPDSVKSMFKITDDATREASQKGIATASQESVDELNGRATAIQGHTFSIMENMKLLLSTTQSILKCLMSIEDETEGFKDRLYRMESNLKEANDNLSDIVTKGIKLKN